MHFTTARLERLQRSLERAFDREWPRLAATRKRVATLRPTPIPIRPVRARSLSAVATVATDGGENKLQLDPIQVQVIRVADSLGEIYFEEFIAQSLKPEELLRWFFQSNERLRRFLGYLQLDWNELMPGSDFQLSQLLSMLRELMEWAALLRLAGRPPARLLIRDGLLRSVLLNERVFQRLREKFEALTVRHGHLLVGVAKHSRVVGYLSVALGLNESFGDGEPAYLHVPPELEREAAPVQYRWIGSRAMGALHIARLDRGEGVPLMPVDVASWQLGRVDEAMALLRESARASFPARGYPRALVEAHEHARLGGLEIELMESLLLEQVSARDPGVARTARRLMLLGRALARGAVEEVDEA